MKPKLAAWGGLTLARRPASTDLSFLRDSCEHDEVFLEKLRVVCDSVHAYRS